jgi:hypothetical protein
VTEFDLGFPRGRGANLSWGEDVDVASVDWDRTLEPESEPREED